MKPRGRWWMLPLLGAAWQLIGCGSGYRVFDIVLPQFQGGTPAYALYHAYGDSITHGSTLVDPETQAYPSLVANSDGLALADFGIPGDQSCDVATRQIFPNSDIPSKSSHGLYTLMIGTNDVQVKGTGAYEAVFNLCQQAAVSWLGVPSENKVLATAPAVTSNGPTSVETANHWNALTTNGQQTTISIPFTQSAAGTVYLWYRLQDSSMGIFQYALDGMTLGIATVASNPSLQTQNGSDNSLGLIRLPAVAAGPHVLTVTQLNTGSEGVGIVGIGMVSRSNASSLPLVLVGTTPKTFTSGATCTPCDVYRADIRANVQLLSSDGLNLRLYESGRFMTGSATDMNDEVHPNAYGHREIALALLDALQ